MKNHPRVRLCDCEFLKPEKVLWIFKDGDNGLLLLRARWAAKIWRRHCQQLDWSEWEEENGIGPSVFRDDLVTMRDLAAWIRASLDRGKWEKDVGRGRGSYVQRAEFRETTGFTGECEHFGTRLFRYRQEIRSIHPIG